MFVALAAAWLKLDLVFLPSAEVLSRITSMWGKAEYMGVPRASACIISGSTAAVLRMYVTSSVGG